MNSLPSSLTSLTFGKYFNSSPDPLPNSLTTLIFGDFKLPLNSLPLQLLTLEFGVREAFSLPDHLPPKLKSLIFVEYNLPLPPLPQSLTELIFYSPYTFPIHAEGTSLTSLFCDSEIIIAPPSLTILRTTVIPQFQPPPSIHDLILYPGSVIKPDIAWSNITYICVYRSEFERPYTWPPNLITLRFINTPVTSLDDLPPSLTELDIGDQFNTLINNLPRSLSKLSVGSNFNQEINNLPPFLAHLTIGNSFNRSINYLPSSLKHFTVGNAFNQPLSSLPPSIQTLDIGSSFNFPINKLPLSYLSFHWRIIQPSKDLLSPFHHTSLTPFTISRVECFLIPFHHSLSHPYFLIKEITTCTCQ